MWYLGSLLLALIIGACSTLIGSRVASLLRIRLKPDSPEGLSFFALLGSGVMMLAAGLYSYLGGRMSCFCLIVAGAIILCAGLTVLERRRNASANAARSFPGSSRGIIATALLCAVICLLSLLLFDAFNPYGDTFTYVSISEYLQSNSFSHPADPNPYYPVWTQPLIYQVAGLRMGALFFLGMVQAFFPGLRAIEVFPAVMAWGAALNIFALFLLGRWCARLTRAASLFAGIMAALTLNPIHYSVHYGLLPQLFGIAFSGLLMALFARELRRSGGLTWHRAAMIGLSAAFVVSSYSELVPILALIAGLAWVCRMLLGPARLLRRLAWAVAAVTSSALFANIELLRMFRALKIQLHAVVGSHIGLSSLQFFGVATGAYPPAGDVDVWFRHPGAGHATYLLVFMVVLALLVAGCIRLFHRGWSGSLLPASGLVVFTLLYAYMYFFVSNPWFPEQRGQTWSMFKLTQWSYPLMATLIASGLSALRPRSGVMVVIGLALALYFVPKHAATARARTEPVRVMTHESNHPFNTYRELVTLINNNSPTGPVELRFSDPSITEACHRLTIAYFFHPRPVFSDWRGAVGVSGYLLPENLNLHVIKPHPTLAPRMSPMASSEVLPAGMAYMGDGKYVEYKMENDWHGKEFNGENWWRWSAGSSTIEFTAPEEMTVQMGGYFYCTAPPRTLSMTLNDQPATELQCTELGAKPLPRLRLKLPQGISRFVVKATGAPIRIGQDPRLFAFQFGNLTFKPVPAAAPIAIQAETTQPAKALEAAIWKDWYPRETDGNRWWRWSAGVSTIEFDSPDRSSAVISGAYRCVTMGQRLRVSLNDAFISELNCEEYKRINLTLSLAHLHATNNILQIISDRPPKKLGNDDRLLAFMIEDFKIMEK